MRERLGMKGFIEFVREQGVVGLAVGFILGGSVSKVVFFTGSRHNKSHLRNCFGSSSDLSAKSTANLAGKYYVGAIPVFLIDFMIIALVVYYLVKGFGFDKLDKKGK